MSSLEATLNNMAPGVMSHIPLPVPYNPRKGLGIYALPPPGPDLDGPAGVLGDALAMRVGFGCTLMKGIPEKVPDGAVVVALFHEIEKNHPGLLPDMVAAPAKRGGYLIRLGRHALVAANHREGLVNGMQTLAMLISRHAGEPLIPGAILLDEPDFAGRGLLFELDGSGMDSDALNQILGFMSAFKANQLHLALPSGVNPRGIGGMASLAHSAQSHGLAITVRLPWAGRVFSGEWTVAECWANLRAVARRFGGAGVALDDRLGAPEGGKAAERMIRSVLDGESGLPEISLHASLFAGKPRLDASACSAAGLSAWTSVSGSGEPEPVPGLPPGMPLQAEIPANRCGFSSETMPAHWRRLDLGRRRMEENGASVLLTSFRRLRPDADWQATLIPAAAGLISAWGNPKPAEDAARSFAAMVYGDMGRDVIAAWDAIAWAFPPDLDGEAEVRLREIAFGDWPESDADMRLLRGVDWIRTAERVNAAAERMDMTLAGLKRNRESLECACVRLRALSWLCRFSVFMPRLADLLASGKGTPAETGDVADNLASAFGEWRAFLRAVRRETGSGSREMAKIDEMGMRLRAMRSDIFE